MGLVLQLGEALGLSVQAEQVASCLLCSGMNSIKYLWLQVVANALKTLLAYIVTGSFLVVLVSDLRYGSPERANNRW